MRDRQTCSDCGKMSPETETNYTLISAQFGWRLTRRRAANGELVVEWRCSDCWREHKKKNQIDEPPTSPGKKAKETSGRVPPPIPPPLPRKPEASAPTPPRAATSRPPPRVSSRPPKRP